MNILSVVGGLYFNRNEAEARASEQNERATRMPSIKKCGVTALSVSHTIIGYVVIEED